MGAQRKRTDRWRHDVSNAIYKNNSLTCHPFIISYKGWKWRKARRRRQRNKVETNNINNNITAIIIINWIQWTLFFFIGFVWCLQAYTAYEYLYSHVRASAACYFVLIPKALIIHWNTHLCYTQTCISICNVH